MQEELLYVDIIRRYLNLVELSIIESLWGSCITSPTLAHKTLISLQKATQSGICLSSLPKVHKVLETCKEFDDSSLDLGPSFVFLDEKDDQVFLHGHVIRVNRAIYLRCMLNTMIVDFKDEALEIGPDLQSKLDLFLGSG